MATKLIHSSSLSQTIDTINEHTFDGRALPSTERVSVAKWLAERQGLAGAYAETFAGFPRERREGILVFTGERITSASARHILGEETCRALRSLRVRDAQVRAALERADEGMQSCLARAALDPRNQNPGKFCCGKCSVSMWRNLLSGGLDRHEERLEMGVTGFLRAHRSTGAKWRVFPFWYTVLALSEMKLRAARAELEFVAPTLERAAKRRVPSDVYGIRRRALASRALSAI
ncbi:MAG: hypothetical protein QM756_09605 [Polyangiaceae bacterium]